jgi:hypothetical protein
MIGMGREDGRALQVSGVEALFSSISYGVFAG